MADNQDSSAWDGQERRNLGATRVQLDHDVQATPPEILKRYQENRHPHLYPKEWIYKNLLRTGMEVLDFGCGTGEISTQLALLGAKKVYGVDVTPGLLRVTAQRAELDGVAGKVEVMCDFIQNIKPRPVDLVIAYAVLHHCHPISRLMPDLLNWLKPGGTFVCVEPVVYADAIEKARVASGVPFEPLDEGEHKLNSEDVEGICNLLESPGRIHYRLLGRADRWLPERALRRVDHLLFKLPGLNVLAGGVLIHGKKKA